MLKDMADSKRLNASIQVLPPAAGTPGRARKRLPDISNMSASVLSGLFWPGIGAHGEEAALKLHPKVSLSLAGAASCNSWACSRSRCSKAEQSCYAAAQL